MFFKRLISFVVLIVLFTSLPVSAAGFKDFEWEDSPETVREKFDGSLTKLDGFNERIFMSKSPTPTILSMVGKTSLDDNPYAIKFCFFEDKLIQIKLFAKSKYSDLSPEVMPNRPVDKFKVWNSQSEHDEILRKLNAKNGRGDSSMNPMTTWDSNSNSIYLIKIDDYIEVSYGYPMNTPWWRSFIKEIGKLQREKDKKSDF